jgi:hypothetical protein
MTDPGTDWLPRANGGGTGQGELLRRSFEDRLERRDDEEEAASLALERLDRLQVAEREWMDALAAIADLPDEMRDVIAQTLALSPEVQEALAALLV